MMVIFQKFLQMAYNNRMSAFLLKYDNYFIFHPVFLTEEYMLCLYISRISKKCAPPKDPSIAIDSYRIDLDIAHESDFDILKYFKIAGIWTRPL